MISHALKIVINELNRHLSVQYGGAETESPGDSLSSPTAQFGNPAEGFLAEKGGMTRDALNFTVVNIREEKSLKNSPNYFRDDARLKVVYENPPVFLNFMILITAPHDSYSNGLLLLSRVIRFFQLQNVFTQESVDPQSLTENAPINELDRLESFKLIFDLYSPTLEEVNHLWGTLGGKQYPFVIYWMRMLDLKFQGVPREGELIKEIVTDFSHK
jgi:hypothetical protein